VVLRRRIGATWAVQYSLVTFPGIFPSFDVDGQSTVDAFKDSYGVKSAAEFNTKNVRACMSLKAALVHHPELKVCVGLSGNNVKASLESIYAILLLDKDGLVSNARDTIVDTYGQATTFLELRAAHGVAQRQNQILKHLNSEFDDDQTANIPSCEYSDRELLHIALKQLAIINPTLSTAQKWDSQDKRWNTFAAFTAYTFIEARYADTTRVTQSAFMARGGVLPDKVGFVGAAPPFREPAGAFNREFQKLVDAVTACVTSPAGLSSHQKKQLLAAVCAGDKPLPATISSVLTAPPKHNYPPGACFACGLDYGTAEARTRHRVAGCVATPPCNTPGCTRPNNHQTKFHDSCVKYAANAAAKKAAGGVNMVFPMAGAAVSDVDGDDFKLGSFTF
jgi:hypothetical protein